MELGKALGHMMAFREGSEGLLGLRWAEKTRPAGQKRQEECAVLWVCLSCISIFPTAPSERGALLTVNKLQMFLNQLSGSSQNLP